MLLWEPFYLPAEGYVLCINMHVLCAEHSQQFCSQEPLASRRAVLLCMLRCITT